MTDLDDKQIKTMKIVIAYPFGVAVMAILLNLFVLDVNAFEVSMPLTAHIGALAIAAIVSCINHSWLMTATELTRVRYRIYATPEEWKASGTSWNDIPDYAVAEIQRAHNAHRNTTENAVYFLMLAVPFIFSSPPVGTTYTWLLGFSIARLGYTYSYLTGKDNLRGVFMSLSLVAMYGVASYLIFSMVGILPQA